MSAENFLSLSVYAFYRDARNANPNQLVFQEYDVNRDRWWLPTTVPQGITDRAPTAVFFNDLIYLFFMTGQSVSFVTMDSNKHWSAPEVVPGVHTIEAPTACVFNNQVYLFFSQSGEHGGYLLWHTIFSQGAWLPARRTGAALINSVGAAVFQNSLNVVVRGTVDDILHRASSFDSFANFQRVQLADGGSPETLDTPALTVDPVQNRMHCFHRGRGSALWVVSTTDGINYSAGTELLPVNSVMSGIGSVYFNADWAFLFYSGPVREQLMVAKYNFQNNTITDAYSIGSSPGRAACVTAWLI